MRNVLIAASLFAVAPGLAGAQSSSADSRARLRDCDECSRDSTPGAMHKQRMARRDQLERFRQIAHELSMVRRSLDDGRDLGAAERRVLQARARTLESQLRRLETRAAVELTARAVGEVRPAVAEARRAMTAVAAEAGIVATGFSPEGTRFPGWIGLTLDARCTVEVRGDDVFWRFFEHPRIVSVEPSSPAERAGIRQGDVLLAYDGQDVRREIAMNRLLQPGRTVRVRVRVRRDGEVRDIPVRVAPPREMAWLPAAPAVVAPGGAKRRSPRPASGEWTMVLPGPGEPVILPELPVTPSAVMAIRRFNGLAGAHMETITRGLGEAVGVERGVLVISVPPGVPAHESGLADGDVILKAGGRDVGSVHELRFAIANSGEKAVKLDVARKGKVRQVTLRWTPGATAPKKEE